MSSLKHFKWPADVTFGYVRKDNFGRIYIDVCATDEEHMTKAPEPGQERRRCRMYVEDMFEEFVGRNGYLLVTVEWQETPWTPTRPAILADALQDRIDTKSGRGRAAHSVKVKKRGDQP